MKYQFGASFAVVAAAVAVCSSAQAAGTGGTASSAAAVTCRLDVTTGPAAGTSFGAKDPFDATIVSTYSYGQTRSGGSHMIVVDATVQSADITIPVDVAAKMASVGLGAGACRHG